MFPRRLVFHVELVARGVKCRWIILSFSSLLSDYLYIEVYAETSKFVYLL